jgi:hypothetical protein
MLTQIILIFVNVIYHERHFKFLKDVIFIYLFGSPFVQPTVLYMKLISFAVNLRSSLFRRILI